MVIERISLTKKGRYALFSEGTFLFSVDEETYVNQSLAEGCELTVQELESLRKNSETRKACDKALQYLSLRDYSTVELYRKLCTKYDEQSSAAAVEKMLQLNLLDDREFARHRARYLLERDKSPTEIRRQLAEKGIDRDTVEDVLEELYQQDEEADPEQIALNRLIQRIYGKRLAEGQQEKVIAALCRRGFRMGAVRAAIEEWTDRVEEEQE